MITAFKKFINKADGFSENLHPVSSNGIPPGIHKLDKELQRKFARGVNYNMKVVIKGDARVGKSSLFLRLRGYGFRDDYNPTKNLNVTSINWNYKATDDIVKIDLWEAIDSSSKKAINYIDLKPEGIPVHDPTSSTDDTKNISSRTAINTSSNVPVKNPIPESAKLSLVEISENLDVYNRADAVLLVMDMTKAWTFKYIQTELLNIPRNIPILVIANFRDQGHHRTVSAEQVRAFIDSLDRTPTDATIMYTEASMKNGFGMKLIEKFFNIPFLKMQELSLLRQLEINHKEYETTLEELNLMRESTNKEYEQYLELETLRRRQHADAMSPVNSGLRQLDEATREQIRNATISSDDIIDKRANVKSLESNNNFDKKVDAHVMANQKFVNDRLPSIVMGAKCPLPESKSIKMTTQSSNQIGNIDLASNIEVSNRSDDDSDEEEVPKANPLVAEYQSDLDSDDQMKSSKAKETSRGD